MPTTQDYINFVETKRNNKETLSIDWNKIPKEVDKNTLFEKISYGMDDRYKSFITNKMNTKSSMELDYNLIPITIDRK